MPSADTSLQSLKQENIESGGWVVRAGLCEEGTFHQGPD